MSEENKRYQELAAKWLNNTISPEEKAEFVAWYNRQQDDPLTIAADMFADDEEHRKIIFERINQRIGYKAINGIKDSGKKSWAYYFAAAVLLIGCTCAFLFNRRDGDTKSGHRSPADEINVHKNQATLTLANGETIKLEGLNTGVISRQSGIEVNKTTEGQLRYHTLLKQKNEKDDAKPVYNTITTSPGGQYEVILPDGSIVWLNASSSLTFPTHFSGNERKVELLGEAYFSIKNNTSPQNRQERNQHSPFIVSTAEQEVCVIGTEFNINSYHNEKSIKTTLVNGAVKVKKKGHGASKLLKPGQQSEILASSTEIRIERVDISAVLAWKNGYFDFRDADIETIIRQFERWYNVEFIYDGENIKDVFVGKIPRSANLRQALGVLKAVGIKFTIEGKKIRIIPQKT